MLQHLLLFDRPDLSYLKRRICNFIFLLEFIFVFEAILKSQLYKNARLMTKSDFYGEFVLGAFCTGVKILHYLK